MLTYLRTVPILRSFDEARSRGFYLGFLGFQVDWEHRFEPGLPLYMQVSSRRAAPPPLRASW
jgi:Glyoxalase superfamily protein